MPPDQQVTSTPQVNGEPALQRTETPKPRPWWYKSLAYATFAWFFIGGAWCVQPFHPILLPTWLTAAIAVALYAVCVWYALRTFDPDGPTGGRL